MNAVWTIVAAAATPARPQGVASSTAPAYVPKWPKPKPSSARGRPEAMSATPTASMTSVEAPPTARICIGTTAGVHSEPNSHGTSSGAVMARIASSGKVRIAIRRTMWPRMAAISSPDRASSGSPTWPMTMLIFFWYSTARL